MICSAGLWGTLGENLRESKPLRTRMPWYGRFALLSRVCPVCVPAPPGAFEHSLNRSCVSCVSRLPPVSFYRYRWFQKLGSRHTRARARAPPRPSRAAGACGFRGCLHWRSRYSLAQATSNAALLLVLLRPLVLLASGAIYAAHLGQITEELGCPDK
jgi:hypothetical protein